MNLRPFLVLAPLLGLLAARGAEDHFPSISLTTLEGAEMQPLNPEKNAFAAIVFITTDCPIANAYMPELNRLAVHAAEKKGKFTLVHVDWDLSVEGARKHASDFKVQAPVVIDRKHELVKATGATITPEAVLVDAAGKVVYRGRINNLFADYGDRRQAATEHDLRDAMDAAAAGKPVAKARVEAIGCYIPDLP